ncbi:MAG TPA: carbohydrate ABC transporter permease [Candidatus Dorea gallistercoris]|uniref:Carbohydrate ABC transporter permease n=1 Tax=Candidatus Dorea gallistercoris TaxID=2838542 RepID=A0A9D1R9S4_9FIRM|nr:carbohydrate ABC transporter permease [Candidatus Dorea gallistercoris]
MKKKKRKLTPAKILVYICLILLAVTIIVPVIWVFVASVKQNSEFYGNPWTLPETIYFQNFIDAWQKANMGSYMLNSVIVTALAIAMLIVISLPAAYVLSRFKFRTGKFWNVLFMAGLFINVSYIVVPIFLMLNNWDIKLRQLTGDPFFLNNLFILALVYTATALPFTIYLLAGYFKTLARDYEEAAYVDGAGYFVTMVKIMFPMAKPSIITIILFNFLSFWNEYIIAMTLMTDEKFKTLPVGLMNLMAAQKSAVEYGQMYAGLVLVMLPTLILYICVQKTLTQGMTLGGLKG